MKQYLLGYDIGSSSIKAALVEKESGACVASDFFPKTEMTITAHESGMAEQAPSMWWENLILATQSVLAAAKVPSELIIGIGISYQMHGLVMMDERGAVLRDAVIWCDNRGVPYGNEAFSALGKPFCLAHLLNSPGNFTAAKLAWVKANEPSLFERCRKILLPGDYIAYLLTGEMSTTLPGLSEGIFWDFKRNSVSTELMHHFGFSETLLASLVPTFGIQGELTRFAADTLGLKAGTPVAYRAGDQPNNALSLGVFNPGEVAATCGTSGVVYAVSDTVRADAYSRTNLFAHVNHTAEAPRLGVMHCVNGAGILYAWARRNWGDGASYDELNSLAEKAPIGASGMAIVPFGNGAERILCNTQRYGSVHGIDFNRQGREHLFRAVQEGIAFAFKYGVEVMESTGMKISLIRAGNANLFRSPLFRETLSGITGATIELYETDGAVGAARGAGLGTGLYRSTDEAFASLHKVEETSVTTREPYIEAYEHWKSYL